VTLVNISSKIINVILYLGVAFVVEYLPVLLLYIQYALISESCIIL